LVLRIKKMNFVNKIALVGTLVAAISAPVMATEGTPVDGKDCVACHKVDMKIVGPSYKDIAAKYKGSEGAVAKLVAKVKSGGAGTWGQMPMPPHPTMSDDELTKIVEWILSLS
jgi:cytochrome c551/c552